MRIHPLTMVVLLSVLIASGGMRHGDTNKALVNVDESGLALQGYDPVSYFTREKPVKGDAKWSTVHHGATYRFASAANRDAFRKEPVRYLPRYGGYCGYGLTRGYLAPVSPLAFAIIDGKLILQYDEAAGKLFQQNLEENLAKADANWAALIEKHGQ